MRTMKIGKTRRRTSATTAVADAAKNSVQDVMDTVTGKRAAAARRRNAIRTGVWATVFTGAGILHFIHKETFNDLVPEELPGTQTQWTYGSGAVELALGAAIANPGTREAAGRAAAWFLLGVWPGNIKMAWDWRNETPVKRAIAFLRVPMQIPMIADVRKLRSPRSGWMS